MLNTRLMLAIATCMMLNNSFATDVETTGTIAAVCSFIDGTSKEGVLRPINNVTKLSSYSGTDYAGIDIKNNSPGGFSVHVTDTTELLIKPAEYTSIPTFSMSYYLVGDNYQAGYSSDSTFALDNAGQDTIQIRNSITNPNSEMFIIGDYSVQNTVTCAAN